MEGGASMENERENEERISGEGGKGGGSPLSPLEYEANIDGMPVKNPSPFFRRMLELDPALFVTEESSKFPLYSKACPSGDKRQPVIITDEEKKEIDRTNPGSYGHALLHGSSQDKKHWYICPRYWCLKTNSSISEEDVKAGKCGAVIPRDALRVPPGAYVYEFNNPRFHMKEDGIYKQHVPGFLKPEKHPDGKCIPCCFGKLWDSKDQVKRRETCSEDELGTRKDAKDSEVKKKTQSYIISSVSYPLPPQRFGFLPIALQLFFNMDTSLAMDPKDNNSILHGKKALLRYGVEKSEKQSFLACFAYFYGLSQKKDTPSVSDMRNILINTIDLDRFIGYHNGNLVSAFRPKNIKKEEIELDKYKNTGFYQTVSKDNETQLAYLNATVASYEAFLAFLNDEDSFIDHTYLWDFFCQPHPQLLAEATNLVILQITENDITERVQFICPSNTYSKTEFNDNNKTVILLKQDQFYEPVRMHHVRYRVIKNKTNEPVYEVKNDDVISKDKKKVLNKSNILVYKVKQDENIVLDQTILPRFDQHSSKYPLEEIKDVLRLIKDVQKQYCRALPSMPKKYDFKQNILVTKLQQLLKTHHYQIESQVVNYKNKVIGLRARKEEEQKWLFVPCYPSAMIANMKVMYMDEPALWLDYRETRDRLKTLKNASNGEIMSTPKIKIEEDGLVIGFLTETNQFVQINPPTQDIDNDGIPIIRHRGYGEYPDKPSADKVLMTVEDEDQERLNIIRNVDMETQFYNMFRSLMRINVNKFEHRAIRKEIMDTIDDEYLSYRKKLKRVEDFLRQLLKEEVKFEVMEKDVLDSISQVVSCNSRKENQPSYCLLSDDGHSVSIFPKTHLLSNQDNEVVYFARMADELVRYSRTQLFMFHPKSYMNITDTEFRIDDNELFLLESRLTRDYFKRLVPYSTKYVTNIQYEHAQPNTSETKDVQRYKNKISLEEQRAFAGTEPTKPKGMQDFIVDCILERTTQAVVGNAKGKSWSKVFPQKAKEIFFGNTITCTYIPLIHIYQEIYFRPFSMSDVKKSLWKGYSDLLKTDGMERIITTILRNQGKGDIMKGNRDLETVLMDENYFISDLDWWVFCSVARLPVVLFSSTSLKQLALQSNWLILNRGNTRKYFFVRTSSTTPTSYHLIEEQYGFEDLKSENMFKDAEQGRENMMSLSEYLKNRVVISRKKK